MLSFSEIDKDPELEGEIHFTTTESKRFANIMTQRTKPKKRKEIIGTVESHFLDSGAFTLKTQAIQWAKKTGRSKWDFYDTKDFWAYIDDYARFVKKYRIAIDYYANVDVIPNPGLTWRNQKYLEEKFNLEPVPTVHYTTNLKWLQKYINTGYKFIGIGGLVGSMNQDYCRDWLDDAFDIVCDTPNRMPRVRMHGFGVTGYELMLRYPWWSVDSSSWTKIGAFGGILVPHKRGGKFVFSEQPYIVKMSEDSPDSKNQGKHYQTMKEAEKRIVLEWLEKIGIALGDEKTKGVLNRHIERRAACLLFFEEMRQSLPKYPWPFHRPSPKHKHPAFA